MITRCCTHNCRQGDDCPVRLARLAQTTATPLNTDNSDGSSTGHAEYDLIDGTGLLMLEGLALVACVVSFLVFALA